MARNIILFSIFVLCSIDLLGQSPIRPYNKNDPAPKTVPSLDSLSLAATGYSFDDQDLGWFPFNDEDKLKLFYDSSEVVKAVDRVSFQSLINSEIEPSSYVDLITFVDSRSLLRADISFQVTSNELQDSVMTAEAIATNKLLEEGGNIALGVNRPIYYNQFGKDTLLYFLADLSVNVYTDVPINDQVFNPRLGGLVKLSGDLRGYNSPKSNFRAGVQYSGAYSFFNSEYTENSETVQLPSRVGYITLEPYIGIGPFEIKYTLIISGNEIFDGNKSSIELTMVPLKF